MGHAIKYDPLQTLCLFVHFIMINDLIGEHMYLSYKTVVDGLRTHAPNFACDVTAPKHG